MNKKDITIRSLDESEVAKLDKAKIMPGVNPDDSDVVGQSWTDHMGETVQLSCPNCGAMNRVTISYNNTFTCWKCRSFLYWTTQ